MTNLQEAARPLMWNISAAWLMYVLFLVALGVFAYGVYRRVASWRRGREAGERLSDWGKRTVILVKELLLQRRVRGVKFPGLFHSLIFYAFAVLVVTTAVVALDYDFGTSLFRGWIYVALTVAAELAGVLILVGVGMATWRRYVRRPATLPSDRGDLWPLALIAGMVVTGFLVEGLRIATAGDPWAGLTPVGQLAALPFLGLSEQSASAVHSALWWTHTVLAMGWIATIPYTKFVHLLALPTNVFFSKLGPRGALPRPDIAKMMEQELPEEAFRVGNETVEDFTWKQRLDFDACIGCGRCEEVCPSHAAGHPFSPRQFVLKSRALVAAADAATPSLEGENRVPLVADGGFDEKFFWYCRTCMACMEVCPAAIDHVDSMIEVRRNEIMMQGRAPADAARAMKLLETKGNPFGPMTERRAWVKELGVRFVKPGESVDVLLWLGCCVAHDPTKHRILEDLCKLLQRCGIDFGVLGDDERCCGDPARVLGDERLFQEVATAQCENIKARDFKLIVTACPHCYNVLKNEYPQFGGKFEVVHHSEFLHEMVWGGELLPKLGLARKVVYHDPCYLGRYQRQFDAPREVLSTLPGVEVVEMQDHRDRSFCCGAGGGHYWMDLHAGERVNNLRVAQAEAAGADTIVTACAFCKQMLDDAVKAKDLEEKIEVLDIASLVLTSLPAVEKPAETPAETPAAQQG